MHHPHALHIQKYMKETDWHHAPLHRFVPGAVHMVTASTLNKEHIFRDNRRLSLFMRIVLDGFVNAGWHLHAWAFLSNHYHLIVQAPEAGDFSSVLRDVHSKVALDVNRMDETPKRQVMYQFWDRCISYDNSYYARMNYVIKNPVKHGIVEDARLYPYCSAAWFERNNRKSFCRRIYSYKCDKVQEPDDFEVVWRSDG
ncbi:MAG: transposase [Verrucomicrobia bacterium]|nr:transposase [Verrucomicrobiota bacterium]MCH8513703.1 hypothetical protein [Kiritimatiellia bacterium]